MQPATDAVIVVSNAINDRRELCKALVEAGEDVADARKNLAAVGEADDLVVCGVGVELVRVHEVDAGNGEGEDGAAAALAAQAHGAALAHVGEVEAADLGHVALAADVVVRAVGCLIEDLLPEEHAGQPPNAQIVVMQHVHGSAQHALFKGTANSLGLSWRSSSAWFLAPAAPLAPTLSGGLSLNKQKTMAAGGVGNQGEGAPTCARRL
eukprot:CAMPEP_0185189656 /NCGR_PEP_ID=MMETSP1140-20130426/6161_1 /TAXON_ID=298111 /ORGANISM="Pavlova sp., Strain CCMP459" /LENGTH=208 /DNA_ID=CAMNT_0027756235 /DNA_START=966 /DNA_END=1588 /DNA_ORIENTATION=+